MKKLMMLAALLAMLAVAAVPAIAQVTQESEQEAESADLDQSVSGSQEGDNSIQCSNPQLTGNTGNAQALNQAISYQGTDPSPSGNAEITLTPNEDVDEVFQCTADIDQAASASG
jgi:opacity protein-like surface antigen